MATYTINNPAFGKVGAQTITAPVANYDEIFRFDVPGGTLGIRKGNQIFNLDPEAYAKQYLGYDYSDPTQNQQRGITNYGQLQGLVQQDFAKRLGVDLGGLKTYNSADLAGAFKLPTSYGTKTGDISQFQNLNPQVGGDIVQGDPNAAPVEQYPGQFKGYAQGSPESIAYGQQGQVQATAQPSAQPPVSIPFRAGLSPQQQSGIANLVANKPMSQWTDVDKKNWAYATGNQPVPAATLTNPQTGEKKVVTINSAEASGLLKAGWSLGAGSKVGGTILTSQDLVDEQNIDLGTGSTKRNSSLADATTAGMKVDVSETDKQIQKNLEILKTPESDLSRQVSKLLGEAQTEAKDLTGRGALQLSEEQKRGIEQQQQVIADKNTELKKKLAEVDALTASYQLANQQEEGRPQTLSRLQGAQGQNYKMYLAQKNALVSEASYIQADLLGLQGKLTQAQNAANRAVDLEFDDREAEYNSKINQLNILLPQLEKEEKKYADAVALTLTQQKEALAEQKQNKRDIQAIKLEAIKSGITDSSVLSQIGNAQSVDRALQIYGQNKPKVSDFQFISGGNQQSGVFDKNTGAFTPFSGGVVTDASGSAYDITTYATDPTHESKVQNILNTIGKMTSTEQMDSYIQQKAPGSPVTGQMIADASQKYGVSWESIMAIMQQDSSFGTAGAGARSFNPGNVGNTETATSTGQLVNFGTWQAGVDAVAKNLAGRKVEAPQSGDAKQIAQTIFSGTGSLSGVSTKNNLRSNVAMELERLKQEAMKGGDVIGMMRASAGGQNMSDTAVTALEKAVNVIGQLTELQDTVDNEATGPIWGIIRSANPYDTKAQLIKAQLTAIVPNLARGIYGEVGVLTDNDVALYAKTLPNLKSTEEVSNLVLAATVRSVQRSIENKMLIQAGSNRDVSGLVGEYQKVKAKADELESNISQPEPTTENQGGFWSKVGNWLFGE